MAKIEDLTASRVDTPMYSSLGSVIDPLLGSNPYGDFLKTELNITVPEYQAMDMAARQAIDAQAATKGYTGDMSVDNNWFGVEGLNTASAMEGLGAVTAGYDIYQNIVGADQKKEKFGKDMQLMDQQIAANTTAMTNAADSRTAFQGATQEAFKNSEDRKAGLGSIG